MEWEKLFFRRQRVASNVTFCSTATNQHITIKFQTVPGTLRFFCIGNRILLFDVFYLHCYYWLTCMFERCCGIIDEPQDHKVQRIKTVNSQSGILGLYMFRNSMKLISTVVGRQTRHVPYFGKTHIVKHRAQYHIATWATFCVLWRIGHENWLLEC